jgi:hypothetical protein
MNAIMEKLMEKLDIDMKGKVSIEALIDFAHKNIGPSIR